jgi:hypothetical protein
MRGNESLDNRVGVSLKVCLSYVLITSIFISGNGIANFGFTLYWYYLIYIPFLFVSIIVFKKISTRLLLVLVVLVAYSLVTYNYGFSLVIKQLFNITFSLLVFYNFLALEQFQIVEIFKKYLTFSKAVLVIGYIQVLLYILDLFGLDTGHFYTDLFWFLRTADMSFRFQSIAQEPSYLAYVFAPVMFLSLYQLLTRRIILISQGWAILFLLAYLLTFSIVAYVGVILASLLIFFNRITVRKIALSVLVFLSIYLFAYLSYNNISLIKLRVDDTLLGMGKGIVQDENYKQLNLSSYAILTNLFVTMNVLKDHPLTGTGLGTHEISYDLYLPNKLKEYCIINREDANSMALRLLSEVGIVGFSLFVFVIVMLKVKYRKTFDTDQTIFWILNSGILVMIVLFLIRNGNYSMHGRLFFLLIYYYSFVFVKSNQNKLQ